MARILIIDDDQAIRRAVRKVLERSGHDVDETAEGIVGIAMHFSQRYDVIITDLRMPDCDGIKVIASLRRFDRRLNIILITGEDHSGTSQQVAELDAVWVLPKPFSMQELELVLQKALEKPH